MKNTYSSNIILSIIALASIPAVQSVQFGGSLGAGLLIVSFLIFIIHIDRIPALQILFHRSFLFPTITLSFALCHSLFFSVTDGNFEPLFLLIALIFMFASAILFSSYISTLNPKIIFRSIRISLLFLIMLGWIDILYPINYGNYVYFQKAVFPFTESSHYALFFGSLSVIFCSAAKRYEIFFILVNMLLLAIFHETVTLLAYLTIAYITYIIRFSAYYNIIIMVFAYMLFQFTELIIGSTFSFLSFANERIFLDMSNLSVLVYLQGWDISYLNLREFYFMGSGFQGMNYENIRVSELSYIIRSLNKSYEFLNLEDGSFLASKLIVEFGIFGIFFIVFYLYYFFVALMGLFGETRDSSLRWCGVMLAFFPEFFIRGVGYFSPSLFLILVLTIYWSPYFRKV